MELEEYVKNTHAVIRGIYEESDYVYLFYFKNHFFAYEPDAEGNNQMVVIPLSTILSLILKVMEKEGWVDKDTTTERIIELNALYLGLMTLALPNNPISEDFYEELTEGLEE